MSALFAIFNKGKKIDAGAAAAMQRSLHHESWYKAGCYNYEALGISVGFTTCKSDFAYGMPMVNETKDVVLFICGEIYNGWDVVTGLKAKGHRFSGDAGYLVHLYEELGENFFEELNGWFFGILIDLRNGKVFVFNDRYGINRVFFHENERNIYFATEAKALLSILPELREFDPAALGEILTCGCTLGDSSLYKDMHVMPSASVWIFSEGNIARKRFYFDAGQWSGQAQLPEKQFASQFIESFGPITQRYTRAATPVGISLTGGLDTRMVIASIKGDAPGYPCYTFGSMYRDTYDVKIAREVAKAWGQPFTVLTLGDEFLHGFPSLLEKAVYISDGYFGFQGATELYLNRMARSISPVRLTGNYGSEVLRRVRAFKYYVPRGNFVNAELDPFLKAAEARFKQLENSEPLSFTLFRQAPLKGFGRLSVERSQLQIRTPFLDNDLVKLLYQAPVRMLRGKSLTENTIEHYNEDLLKICTDRGLFGGCSSLTRLLRCAVREAFFKAEYWSSHGMPSWLSNINHRASSRFLENCFIGRHKFQHFRLWSQRELSNYVYDTLLQGVRELKAYFNTRSVEALLSDHMSGRNNYTNEIDVLLTVVLANKMLLKNPPQTAANFN